MIEKNDRSDVTRGVVAGLKAPVKEIVIPACKYAATTGAVILTYETEESLKMHRKLKKSKNS